MATKILLTENFIVLIAYFNPLLLTVILKEERMRLVDYTLIGQRIKEERTKQGISQDVLSEKADISQSFLGQIERGERKFSLKTLIKIADSLETSLDYLVYDYKPKSNTEIDELFFILKDQKPEDIQMISDIIRRIIRHYKDKIS
jgi:transcriptional regulator with XRE-family HTH domain